MPPPGMQRLTQELGREVRGKGEVQAHLCGRISTATTIFDIHDIAASFCSRTWL